MWNLHFDGLACLVEAERGGDTTGSNGRDRAHRRLVAAAQLKESRRIVALADAGDWEFSEAVLEERREAVLLAEFNAMESHKAWHAQQCLAEEPDVFQCSMGG